MDNRTDTTQSSGAGRVNLLPDIQSATPLTPLQLNGIRIDVKHTILTPDYLDSLVTSNDSASANS